jgi:hypothetical protein
MKRILTAALVLSLLGVTPAFAAGPGASSPSASAKTVTVDSLVKSAGLDQIVADQSRTMARRDLFAASIAAPRAPQQKKSFWKTPWPYVIIGGVVAAGVIIATSGGSGSGY